MILGVDITAAIAFNFYYQHPEKSDLPFYSLATDNPDLKDYDRVWLVLGYIKKSSHSLGQPDHMELPEDFFSNMQATNRLLAPYAITVAHHVQGIWSLRGVTVILLTLNRIHEPDYF